MAGSSKKILSILVIEDNQADVEMIRIFLEDSKPQHQLLNAESLSEGFYLLEEHDIDIVLRTRTNRFGALALIGNTRHHNNWNIRGFL